MKFTTTLRLFLAVCVLAGAIWVLELRSDSDNRKKQLSYSLFAIKAEEVNSFTLERGDFNVTCAKANGEWLVMSPLNAKADEGEVDRILNLFESIPREETITPAQRMARDLTLKDYGLLDYRARIVLSTNLGEKDLLMGYNAPLGDLMYVMYGGGEDVIGVHRSLLGIFPEKVEALRDRQLLHGDAGMTSRLEIQRPGLFIQLSKDENGWMIRQPIVARADAGKVSRILDKLYELRASSFVWDPVVKLDAGLDAEVDVALNNTVGDATYNLKEDDASAMISVWVNGDEVGKQVIIGAVLDDKKDKVYAKMRDSESIYSIEKSILDAFAVTVEDLRDTALFFGKPSEIHGMAFEKGDKQLVMSIQDDNSWRIDAPVQWQADSAVVMQTLHQVMLLRAETFVSGVGANMTEYGLEPCVYSITLTESSPETPGKADAENEVKGRKLLVGGLADEGRLVHVSFEGSGEVMTVPSSVLSGLGLKPVDPLVYMDRTMLSVSPAEIKRISLLKKGKTQVVEIDEGGKWTVSMAPYTNDTTNLEFDIDSGAMEDVLLNSANLRASRVEKHNPDDLSKYGLDKPSAVLTIGLASGEGIQKSLMIGGEAGTHGLYAIVHGQDVVFVLARNIVNQLTRDLIKASIKLEVNEEAQ